MLSNENIICLGSEKWGYPGLQQTIMKKLSDKNNIIYINSLGTRTINFKSSTFSFYLNRAYKYYFNKNKSNSNGVKVCNPYVIPISYNDMTIRLNRKFLRLQIDRIKHKFNFNEYILWVGTPSVAPYLDLFTAKLKVYNPVDRYSEFPFVNKEKIKYFEALIAKSSDLIICTSDAIRDDFINLNKFSFIFTHGVDFQQWYSSTLTNSIPSDISKIKKPIIGYFGSLSPDVFDFELINKVSENYPHCSIVLIGKINDYASKILNRPNIFLLGYKNYSSLPYYLKQFDVCLIPFYVNELMQGVDPIKLREYLTLGKPVVSVALPEVQKLGDVVYIGNSYEDFIMLIGKAIEENNSHLTKIRIKTAIQSDWNIKLEELSKMIYNVL